jgi:serine/threonine protein kinase
MEEVFEISGRRVQLRQSIGNSLYVAHDLDTREFLTLKYIRNPSNTLSKLLKTEAKHLRELNPHPNIVNLIGLKEADNEVILLYDYAKDGNLETHKIENPIQAIHQIALALHHMHFRPTPIVHRNLVPRNIFLINNTLKVGGLESSDKIIPQFSEYDTQMIESELRQVTDEKWRAPELMNIEEGYKLNTKVDIWNLGMVLYYIMYGFSPFSDARAQMEGEYAIPGSVPSKIRDLLKITLDPNPAKRCDISAVLDKIAEQPVRKQEVQIGCGIFCIPNRAGTFPLFKSRKSSSALVYRSTNNDQNPPRSAYIDKLLHKAWAKPMKIKKFFEEMLRMKDLEVPQTRLKALTLLHVYMQRGPNVVIQERPGVIQVLEHILNNNQVRSNDSIKSEYFRQLTQVYCAVLTEKFTIQEANNTRLTGLFGHKQDLGHDFMTGGVDLRLVEDCINYWESLLGLHEVLGMNTAPLSALRKYTIDYLIAEERSLVLLIDKLLRLMARDSNFDRLWEKYSECYDRCKDIFGSINEHMPVNKLQHMFPELIEFDQCDQPSDLQVPVHTESESLLDTIQIVIDSKYSTAKQESSSHFSIQEFDLIDLTNEQVSRFQSHIKQQMIHWEIGIDEIELKKKIGVGSSCEVWCGNYRRTPIAVKKLKIESMSERSLKEFGREISVLCRLRHPNVLMFIGAHIHNPFYIITELCTGGDLFSLLHKQKDVFISWEQKLKMCLDISRGMHFLHSINIMHRDLKSLNLLLVSPVQKPTDPILLKISDFGLSKEYSEQCQMTGQLGTYVRFI